MPWDGVRRIIWAKHFDEMEIIGNDHFSIGVPIKADPEFKAMLFAAAITHIDGNKSIDYIYKKYREVYLSAFDDDARCPVGSLKELTLHIGEVADNISRLLSGGHFTPKPTSGQAYAANVLIRMRSTFHAINQLIFGGLALEAESVIRQGIEQCAWALAVMGFEDIESIDQTSPTKSISLLKKTFPGAGRIYGQLSNSAHASLSSRERFLEFRNDKLTISIRSIEKCRSTLIYSVMLLDTYASIATSLLANMEHNDEQHHRTLRQYKYDLIERYKDQFTDEDRSIYHSWRGV